MKQLKYNNHKQIIAKNGAYATHLYVLESIFNTSQIKSVFQFGSGLSSTPLFVKAAQYVHAIQMQDESWFNVVQSQLSKYPHFNFKCQLGPFSAINSLRQIEGTFDLIFVDGHGDSRPQAIMQAFKHTKLIVTHDTQNPGYGWDRIIMPDGWVRYDDIKYNPKTTMFVFGQDAQKYKWIFSN